VDYFTKWVETKALANITAPTIQKFFWQNIVDSGSKPSGTLRSMKLIRPEKCFEIWKINKRPKN
jgi:hypothetical protein